MWTFIPAPVQLLPVRIEGPGDDSKKEEIIMKDVV